MSRQINQPINQVKLTNVAVVRMNRGGKRFEIACYRNKVVNYRQGLETDLSEVLQTDRIFTNVSKGQFAKSTDLQKCFGTRDEEQVAKMILERGTLQVSDLERNQQLENIQREVATWISNNCVHPTSQRPYTIPQIREAMREAEFAPHPTRTIKKQYLDCVKLLQSKQILPIERAKMKLQLVYPVQQAATVQQELDNLQVVPVETPQSNDDDDDEAQVVVLVDPSLYQDLDTLAKDTGGRLEILKQVVRQEGDVNLELELERKKQNTTDQAALSTDFERVLNIDDEGEADETPAPQLPPPTSCEIAEDFGNGSDVQHANLRQTQKKAQKKSKKAKRREKEEALERQARIEAERQRQQERASTSRSVEQQPSAGSEEVKSCNTCGGSFSSAALYRAHFKSDWHRYNIKLKMKGVAPVSEQEFLLCDSDAFFDNV